MEFLSVRFRLYSTLATQPPVDAMSVKGSSIGSQLQPLGLESTGRRLVALLSRLYRRPLEQPAHERPIVMLDMEAYRHAELTLAVLMNALEDTELDQVRAGIVLQAYLPDSANWQRRLITWAKARVARGGRPIRMRIVKGANLA